LARNLGQDCGSSLGDALIIGCWAVDGAKGAPSVFDSCGEEAGVPAPGQCYDTGKLANHIAKKDPKHGGVALLLAHRPWMGAKAPDPLAKRR
jgi:hypothetical protein